MKNMSTHQIISYHFKTKNSTALLGRKIIEIINVFIIPTGFGLQSGVNQPANQLFSRVISVWNPQKRIFSRLFCKHIFKL